jgi:glycosyltransferase involved in cell wall biosynthesis
VIEAELSQSPLPNVHWLYYDLPAWAKFWKRGSRGLRPYYYLWQLGAYLYAARLHRKIKFDLVHHFTFVNYWMPSFLSLLPVPFVWGPVGGGESTPPAFDGSFGVRGLMYERARNLARRIGHHDPFVRLTAKRAVRAFSTTEQTKRRMEALGCRNVLVYSEAGLPTEEIARLNRSPRSPSGDFSVLSIGRLLHWKGFDLGLRAFAHLRERVPQSRYWIIGTGPERERLEQLAAELGIADAVHWLGKVDRQQTLARLRNCDVLMHPSLHDSGGWVCLEAMAAEVPVVCLDLGGPAEQVTGETGFKVSASSPEAAVAGLSEALLRLQSDPALRAQMGAAGSRHVRERFDWNVKGDWMNDVYQVVHASH